jgi:CheY-like chemotaxis protein
MRIMVVDDETEVLKLIKTLVEPLDVEALTMADSREAAQRANTDKFDGVFVDSKMPFLDGFELTRIIRASPANSKVPIVMLTAMNDVETMRKGFKVGVTFFLSKPVNLERLNGLVRVMRAPMLKERRRYARLPLRTGVTCQFANKQFQTTSVDMSEGGLLLDASGGAGVGQELTLQFSLTSPGRALKLRAKVVRKEAPDRIAVQFLNAEAEDRDAIREYITGRVKP